MPNLSAADFRELLRGVFLRLPGRPVASFRTLVVFALASWVLTAVSASGPQSPSTQFYATPFERRPDVATLTALGRTLFFDKALSASGRMACSSCHDPGHAWGPPNRLPVQMGGPKRDQPGLRAVPSLKYRETPPPFNEHFFDSDGNDSEDQGPTGGLGWDGRSDSAHQQAAEPLLSPFEMANKDSATVIANLKRSASAGAMRAALGEHVFDDPQKAWVALLWALEVFQQSPADFYPFNSKYDAFLRGQVRLSQIEQRGLVAFNDPRKGNCAQCHPSRIKRGAFPMFTDAGYAALGLPRNKAIPANASAQWHDLGLCGPLRQDLKSHREYCGMFRVPSLRNVALRQVFFHNGIYTSLQDAVRFYTLRDSHPERIYPHSVKGAVQKLNDLPPAYQANVNREAPFGPASKLTEADVSDIVAFLKTLTDGYRVTVPAR